MSNPVELARELVRLQQDFREHARSEAFRQGELMVPTPGGYVEQYRRRIAEIIRDLVRLAR